MEAEPAPRHAVCYVWMPAQELEPVSVGAKSNSTGLSMETDSLAVPGHASPWHAHSAPTNDWIRV